MEIIERCYLEMRNMRKMFFVPLVMYYILVPIMCFGTMHNPMMEGVDLYTALSDTIYSIVPLASGWWAYLVLKEYIEGDGNEILVIKGGIGAIMGNFYCLTIFGFLPLLAFVPICGYQIVDLFLQMSVIAFLVYGIVIGISFLLRNIAAAILALLGYVLLNISMNEFFSFIEYKRMLGNLFWMEYALPLLVLGAILWGVGIMKSTRYE